MRNQTIMTKSEIKNFADEMGVSVTDLMSFAQSVANSIEQDKAVDAFINASDEDSTKMTQAYAAHAVKKSDQFTTKYLTNPEARSTFQTKVFNDLKA